MNNKIVITTAILFALSAGAARAQGFVGGAEEGADEGGYAAGPVGAVVGGAVGAAAGLIGVDERPRFRTYVEEERIPSYDYRGPVRVGEVLPEEGINYYDVPAEFYNAPPEYGAPEYTDRYRYRYTVINDEPVLVEPRTHRIVEVIY